MFSGATLLITGGTGSFGTATLNRLLKTDIGEIRIFSRDEKKQDDMRKKIGSDRVKFYLGDVRDIQSVNACMVGVDYVFHAAALKQVPSCEFYPMEAIKTNTLGAGTVMDAAIQHGVKTVICLSTDKAVYPINAMGMSKALMEKLVVSKSRSAVNTKLMCTRYGNVMASRGSVIPLFVEQIKSHRPITITDPSMTRFMMSLEDAIDLVLYAFQNGDPGDTLVQKAPAATIHTLAVALQEIFESDSQVEIIGTRHGEKLYETLLTREEFSKAEDLDDYFRVAADGRDLNYGSYFSEGRKVVSQFDDYNSHNTHMLDVEELKTLLLKLRYIQSELGA